jgi:hypothetical protein
MPPAWVIPKLYPQAWKKFLQRVGRSHQRVAVGGIGDGAVGDVFETGLTHDGESVDAVLDEIGDMIDVRLQFGLSVVPGHPFGVPLLDLALVKAQDQAVHFLANVDERSGSRTSGR